MGDTNFISTIVKILEIPRCTVVKGDYIMTHCRVQLPQIRKNKFIDLVIWGKLAEDITKYYRTNDYVLVEGFLSSSPINLEIQVKRKKATLTVIKLYPFLLNPEN